MRKQRRQNLVLSRDQDNAILHEVSTIISARPFPLCASSPSSVGMVKVTESFAYRNKPR